MAKQLTPFRAWLALRDFSAAQLSILVKWYRRAEISPSVPGSPRGKRKRHLFFTPQLVLVLAYRILNDASGGT